jgi:formylglycine-generating enzyme required for sulfatase activity
MNKALSLFLFLLILIFGYSTSFGKELPKIAVWDLISREVKATYAQELTSILVSEISKLGKYEVYSQENVRTIAGWTEERMKLGCTSTQCLTALGQMDIAKLISGSVGRIGNTFSISLNLFDTQNAKAEKAVSEFCRTEDDLIPLVQVAVRKLLGEEVAPSKVEEKAPEKAVAGVPPPLPGRPFTDRVTGMEFVFIKGGCFQMGDTFGDGTNNEKPVHEVCVDDFYLGKYEVRVGDFRKFVNETGYKTEAENGDGCYTRRGDKWEKDRNANWRNPGFAIDDRHPVVCVSWNDSMAFMDWLKGKTGKQYRLPTEAEWEYAGRNGGKEHKYSWGNGDPSGNIADESAKRRFSGWTIWDGYDDGYIFTAPVGSFRPNELGLYDMTGNVWEWCSDWYGENYYQRSLRNNPEGPGNGSYRVLRGGSWLDDPWGVRTARRVWLDPTYRSRSLGCRLGVSAR